MDDEPAAMRMKRITKYALKMAPTQQLSLPLGASLLSVGVMHGTLVLWALSDAYSQHDEMRAHTIDVYAEGATVRPDCGRYLGTVQLNGNVFHVFEYDPPSEPLSPDPDDADWPSGHLTS